MSMSLGNTSASSLLNTAKTAYDKQQTYNDSLAAYEFELSAKTPQDYQKYSNYLDGRIKTVGSTDPSKALTLTKTQTSAFHSFTSSQISRDSLAVKYGDLSNTDKYNKMLGYLNDAIGNGDEGLAQSLESQLGSLSVTIQNEANAAASAGAAASAKAATQLKEAYLKDQDGSRDANGNVINPGGLGVTSTKQLLNIADTKFQQGQMSLEEYEATKAGLVGHLAGLQDAASTDTRLDAETRDKYQSDLASTTQSGDFKKFAAPGVATAIKNGEQPFALEVDAFGNKSLQKRELISTRQANGPDGKPLFDEHGNPISSNTYQQDYATGGKFNSFYRKDQNGNLQPYTVSTLPTDPSKTYGKNDSALKHGEVSYMDPVTGKTLYIKQGKDGKIQRSLADADTGTNPFALPNIKPQQTDPFSITDDLQNLKDLPGEAWRGVGRPLAQAGSFLASHAPGQPVLNFAGGLVGSLLGRSDQAAKQKQQAAEYEVAQEAARQRANPATMAAIRAATPPPLKVAPVPKAAPSKAFLPAPVVPMSPSQIFAQTAGKNPSNANIAKGIAAAVGINPNFKF